MCFKRLVSFVPGIQRELLYPATCTQLGGRKHLPYPKPENPDMSKPRELQRLPGVDPHALYSVASDMQKSSERGVKGDGRGFVL